MTQILTLAILTATLVLQILNARKYWRTNGANTTRVTLMLANLFFIVHTFRLVFGLSSGYFFTLGILCLFSLYSRSWIRDKLKI